MNFDQLEQQFYKLEIQDCREIFLAQNSILQSNHLIHQCPEIHLLDNLQLQLLVSGIGLLLENEVKFLYFQELEIFHKCEYCHEQ
jgi:hypothetical protein